MELDPRPTVAGLVPIKLRSQRAPAKNVRRLGSGPPLLHHILKTMLTVPELTSTYVYCSEDRFGWDLPLGATYLRREPRLDSDATLIGDVLTSFAHDVPADIYVLAHATAPFMLADSISSAVRAVLSGEYDSALTVRPQQEFTWSDGVPENYSLDRIPRTQDLPVRHIETTGLYVYRRELILEQGRRVGERPFLVEVSKVEAIDINDEDDFMIASAVYDSMISKPGDAGTTGAQEDRNHG